MTYVLGPHKKMGITTSQATEASMSFWAKKKGLGIWDFEGEKDHVQKDGNVWETNVYPAMQRQADTEKTVSKRAVPSSPSPRHLATFFAVISDDNPGPGWYSLSRVF